MIIKVKALKKPDFDRVIRYILKDSTSQSFILRHNLRGKKMTDWITEFQGNERDFRQSKRKNATILTHEIMSFAKKDTSYLSSNILKDLARRYIDLRGRQAIVLATPHFDRDHIHIHFVFSGIAYKSSNSMRMSKTKFREVKQSIQQYQLDKYPELTHSIVWHGKGSPSIIQDKEYRTIQRLGESDKQVVRRLVQEAHRSAKSDQEFYALLAERDISVYERGGKIAGMVYKGRKYRWRVLYGQRKQQRNKAILTKENNREV